MESSDSEAEYLTPPEIRSAAQETRQNLLPDKSKKKYEGEYLTYERWKDANNVKKTSENVLLAYFAKLSRTKKPSTLWAVFSMLKSTIDNMENINIGIYTKVISFLKKQKKGFESKKAKVFTAAQINDFLEKAPDVIYLVTKVVTIFGVYGACRGGEFINIETNHIENHNNVILVRIPDNKTKTPRSFTVEGKMCEIIRKYAALRSSKTTTNRFFMNYQHGKCTTQVIGKHKFEKMPKEIAMFLNLEDPHLYTGHAFRRTSATLLADAGANITMLKRHGGWRSTTVAEGYVESSIQNKRKIGTMINNSISKSTSSDDTNQIRKRNEELSPPPPKVAKVAIKRKTSTDTSDTSNMDLSDCGKISQNALPVYIDESDDNEVSEQTCETAEKNQPIINITNCNFYFQTK